MKLFPVRARGIFEKCAIAVLGCVLVMSAFSMIGQEDSRDGPIDNPRPNSSPSYYAIPSGDPDDGKFLGVFGAGLQTLSGLTTQIYIGVPSNESSFEVGIFDAEVTANWDYDTSGRGLTIYKIYKDPLKSGAVSMLLDNWTSEDGINDDFLNKNYTVDNDARAPSGNYFYRLEISWEDPSVTTANLFKVRSTGQLSLAKNQEFGFAGAPQNLTADPCVGEPGNTYDGAWDFYFYVPTKRGLVKFRDGDSDRYLDTDDFNTPNVDPDGAGPAIAEGVNNGQPQDTGPDNPYGTCAIIEPSVYYYVEDPAGNQYNNTNPAGNTEWENFIIEYNSTDADHNTSYVLPAGLWQLDIRALDGHNGDYFNTSFEIFTSPEPPLPVSPPPTIKPPRTEAVEPGDTVDFGHLLTNRGVVDNFDLAAASSRGWTTRIYEDVNKNWKLDPGEPEIEETGLLGQNQFISIIIQLVVPLGTEGMTDNVTTTATSQNEWAVQGSVIDKALVVKDEMPIANAGGPYTVYENEPLVFNGSGSVDPEGDPLVYRWDFESDGVWDTSWSSDPYATVVWGDDYSGMVTLEVKDPGGSTSSAVAFWSVVNVVPTATLIIPSAADEGQAKDFVIQVKDPGSDDTEVIWDWGEGTVESWKFYNNGVSPDPYPSPDINPVQFSITRTHDWGDNGVYTMKITLKDDDTGHFVFTVSIQVHNLKPISISFSAPTSTDEGKSIHFSSEVSDPGSDDLTFEWEWGDGLTDTVVFFNDGVGPDPFQSPHGIYPFNVTCDMDHAYGDDGSYTLNLDVTDDDGDSLSLSTVIDVYNVVPAVTKSDFPSSSNEGDAATFSVDATDPGSDDIILEFDWGDGTTETIPFYNDGVGPDPDPSPLGIYPFSISVDIDHIYGDNGNFTVTMTVMDDDGDSVTITKSIVVNNVDPTIDPNSVEAKAIVDLTLRVAGEKWHDVSLVMMKAGVPVQLIHIVRMPGSPDDQSKTVNDVTVNLFEKAPLMVYYTPLDDPVNGQLWGSTPVWVIMSFEDGTESWLNHTFNVRHPHTWTWLIRDISAHFLGKDITFSATASDPGSDDLTFTWEWGDGTTSTSIYFNNGVSPDPYPSPDVNPIAVTDIQVHAFMLPKVYNVTITVVDDDAGSASLTFTLQL